ncbi:autophagy protein [Halenospora varia]|nr:autophagy protein [Halenospora varia]
MATMGAVSSDTTVVELELSAHKAKDFKINDIITVEEGKSEKERVDEGAAEPTTTRWELWAWYAYYFGNNSAGTLSYAPLIFQSLLNQAGRNGYNLAQDCSVDAEAPCVVKFGVKNVNIDTVVLICNGLVFAFQGVILITFGSMGDYGKWKKWILICSTLVCWAMQLSFLGLKDPSQYQAAIGIYVVSSLSYNICQAFWTPSFPMLARNTPEALESKKAFLSGEMTEDEFEKTQMLQRNRLSNIAFGCMSLGYTFTLLIALGAAYGLHANDSSVGNLKAAVVIVGVATGVWILCGTPWFFLEKPRAAPLPPGETYFSVGAKAYFHAFKSIPKLTQTWLYLLGYFLISDGYATTNQIYGICQNGIVSYSTTTSTELYIVQGLSNAGGIALFWLIQRHFKIRTKIILLWNCAFLLVIPIWGCIGIGTTKFGFHNLWEVWTFSVVDCAAVAPFYAFSATMLSDICPKGREVTFFALYALVSKSTAWIGPIISGIIIDRTGNTNKGFAFSLGLTVVGYACICFVDVKKGKEQCERYVLEDPTLVREK